MDVITDFNEGSDKISFAKIGVSSSLSFGGKITATALAAGKVCVLGRSETGALILDVHLTAATTDECCGDYRQYN